MKSMISSKWRARLPFLTLVLSLCTLLISCTSLRQVLQYDRAAIAGGHLWLLITGHLSHWSLDHLLWDLLVFVVLGAMVEGRSRYGLILCLSLAASLISASLWFWQPEMGCYRGLSGLDSALFGFVALWMVREKIGSRDWQGAALVLVAGVAFLLKIVYEIYTMQAVFSSSAGLFTPVPLAHLAGGLAGIGAALCCSDTRSADQYQTAGSPQGQHFLIRRL